MKKPILLLPVGGSASRMLGLPKFMLPASESETLIEKHCRGAIAAGYEEIHIITRKKYFNLIEEYFADKDLFVRIHVLPYETRTMSETLRLGSELISDISDYSVTIGLADTAFLGSTYEEIYGSLLNTSSDFALGLFDIRVDQFGKLGQVELDVFGKILSMQDKTPGCPFPTIWGLAKVPGTIFAELDIFDAHIGIGIEKLVSEGEFVSGIMNRAEYFDCGTFSEYRQFLNQVIS